MSEFITGWNPLQWNWGTGLSNLGTGINNFMTLDPNVRVTTGGQRITTGAKDYNEASDTFTFGDLITPKGTGDNAQSILQLGLGFYGAMNQKKAMEQQLEEARRQFAYQKDLTRSNFQNQATNWGNQALFQTQMLNDFNSDAGAIRAADLNAGFNQLNAAGNRIGLDNVVSQQQNQLQRYNKLAGA